jgi:predicted kinase
MVGVPGSGKTTVARNRFPDALRISLDDIRLMLSGKTFDLRIEPAVAVAADSIKESLAAFSASKGIDLLFDATNVSRERRAALIATARRHGLSPVAVYLAPPMATAHERNLQRPFPVPTHVVRRFGQILEPPTLDEGFDQVIVVSDDGNTLTTSSMDSS